MSTNYYLRKRGVGIDEAEQFGNHIEMEHEDDGEATYVHICKTMYGAAPLFEGNPLMRSVADIRAFLEASPEWTIRDEYGRSVGPDELFAKAQRQNGRARAEGWRTHEEAAMSERFARPGPGEYWTDGEGYEFTSHTFV